MYENYGYYSEKVVSVTLPVKDGVQKMADIMAHLRANPPKEIAGLQVTAVLDYDKGVRVSAEGETRLDTPASNVLYFELEKGNWVCVRPSGTEPKIKLYVNTRAESAEASAALNEALKEASQALMA